MKQSARVTYLSAAWLFVAGVAIQVFLAGMVVVAARMGWNNHAALGHALGLPLLIMLVSVYLGQFSPSTKRLTWLLFVVYVVQADVIIFMRGTAPVVAALHPVLALVDFALGLALARRALIVVRAAEQATGNKALEPATGD